MSLNFFQQLVSDPNYWGMDITQYPGDELMRVWKNNSPLQFTGFYLAPSPNQSNTSWMDKRAVLAEQGWGFAPIYMGQQSGSGALITEQGELDAQNAAELAQKAGFTTGTYIYLDIEETGFISSNFITYISAFVRKLHLTGYLPAIYCNYKNAYTIKNSAPLNLRFWVANYLYGASISISGTAPSPANSGVIYAAIWQLAERIPKSFGGYRIESLDINSSIYINPSI